MYPCVPGSSNPSLPDYKKLKWLSLWPKGLINSFGSGSISMPDCRVRDWINELENAKGERQRGDKSQIGKSQQIHQNTFFKYREEGK